MFNLNNKKENTPMQQYYLHLNKKEYNDPWSEIKRYFTDEWENEDLYRSIKETLKQLLQSAMQVELNGMIKAMPYQRIAMVLIAVTY